MHVLRWMHSHGVDVLATDAATGFCILHAACKAGHAELVEELLTWDAFVDGHLGQEPLSTSTHRPEADCDETCRCSPLSFINNERI